MAIAIIFPGPVGGAQIHPVQIGHVTVVQHDPFANRAIQLAARGLNLVLIARRAELLDSLAARLSVEYAVQVRPLAFDLAQPNTVESIAAQTDDIEIGLRPPFIFRHKPVR